MDFTYIDETPQGKGFTYTGQPKDTSGFQMISPSSDPSQDPTGNNPLLSQHPNDPNMAVQSGDNYAPRATVPYEQHVLNDANAVANGEFTAELPENFFSLAKMVANIPGRIAGAVANTLPATSNILPAIGETADEALIKSMRGRVTGVNPADMRSSAQAARDIGLDDVFSTAKGRRETLSAAQDAVGKKIGDTREAAGFGKSTEQQIRDYIQAHHAGDASAIKAAEDPLSIIRAQGGETRLPNGTVLQPPTYKGLADASTYLNKAAKSTDARQAENAMTEVANLNSKFNNQNLMAGMTPEQSAEHAAQLKEFGDLHRLNPVQEAGERKTMGSVGSGGGLWNSLITNTIERPALLRATSKGLNTLHDLGSNLDAVTNPAPAIKELSAYLGNPAEHRDDEDDGR